MLIPAVVLINALKDARETMSRWLETLDAKIFAGEQLENQEGRDL
jgi:hypothetical protein